MRFRHSFLLPTTLLVLGACGGGGSDSSNPNNNPTSPNPGNPNPPAPTGPVETSSVTVDNDVFTPSDIKVPINTLVKWTWSQNAVTHNVTLGDGTSSGDKNAGDSFTKTFATAGTFSYRCTIHPSMTGSVLVTP